MFLGVDQYITWMYGSIDASRMQLNFQWWRFLTPALLVGSVGGWLYDTIYVIVLGSLVESIHGFKITAYIWLVSAFSGSIFAALVSPTVYSYG